MMPSSSTTIKTAPLSFLEVINEQQFENPYRVLYTPLELEELRITQTQIVELLNKYYYNFNDSTEKLLLQQLAQLLAQRWERIKNTNMAYPYAGVHPINIFLLDAAEFLSHKSLAEATYSPLVASQKTASAFLMPTAKTAVTKIKFITKREYPYPQINFKLSFLHNLGDRFLSDLLKTEKLPNSSTDLRASLSRELNITSSPESDVLLNQYALLHSSIYLLLKNHKNIFVTRPAFIELLTTKEFLNHLYANFEIFKNTLLSFDTEQLCKDINVMHVLGWMLSMPINRKKNASAKILINFIIDVAPKIPSLIKIDLLTNNLYYIVTIGNYKKLSSLTLLANTLSIARKNKIHFKFIEACAESFLELFSKISTPEQIDYLLKVLCYPLTSSDLEGFSVLSLLAESLSNISGSYSNSVKACIKIFITLIKKPTTPEQVDLLFEGLSQTIKGSPQKGNIWCILAFVMHSARNEEDIALYSQIFLELINKASTPKQITALLQGLGSPITNGNYRSWSALHFLAKATQNAVLFLSPTQDNPFALFFVKLIEKVSTPTQLTLLIPSLAKTLERTFDEGRSPLDFLAITLYKQKYLLENFFLKLFEKTTEPKQFHILVSAMLPQSKFPFRTGTWRSILCILRHLFMKSISDKQTENTNKITKDLTLIFLHLVEKSKTFTPIELFTKKLSPDALHELRVKFRMTVLQKLESFDSNEKIESYLSKLLSTDSPSLRFITSHTSRHLTHGNTVTFEIFHKYQLFYKSLSALSRAKPSTNIRESQNTLRLIKDMSNNLKDALMALQPRGSVLNFFKHIPLPDDIRTFFNIIKSYSSIESLATYIKNLDSSSFSNPLIKTAIESVKQIIIPTPSSSLEPATPSSSTVAAGP